MNEKLKQSALKLIEDIDVGQIESIDISSSDYNDGTNGLTITLTYPAKGGEKE